MHINFKMGMLTYVCNFDHLGVLVKTYFLKACITVCTLQFTPTVFSVKTYQYHLSVYVAELGTRANCHVFWIIARIQIVDGWFAAANLCVLVCCPLARKKLV